MLQLPQLFHGKMYLKLKEFLRVQYLYLPLLYTGVLLPQVSPLSQRSMAATVGWLRTGQQLFSHAAMADLWERGGGSSTLQFFCLWEPGCQCWTRGCYILLSSCRLLLYCLLSLDTLCASQFTLVFQLSRRASLNFSLKCFSASSSVFPRARESFRYWMSLEQLSSGSPAAFISAKRCRKRSPWRRRIM